MASAQELEGYARDCVRLVGLCDDPVIKERLIEMAHDWMSAVIEADDGAANPLRISGAT
jgi:hypothetical protein